MSKRPALAEFVATFGYVGKVRFAPGTFGSVAGLVPCVIMAVMPPPAGALFLAAVIAIALWSAGLAESRFETNDPGAIVIDEVAGIMVALYGHPLSWGWFVAGLVAFRLLDILKPFPVGWLDRRLKGGLGIVADDVAAGLMTNAGLRLAAIVAG
jgi:phosphatidylglycerophosphatase A